MIVIPFNTHVFEMPVAFMPRVMSLENKGDIICAPIRYKLGRLYVKYPQAIIYQDGI